MIFTGSFWLFITCISNHEQKYYFSLALLSPVSLNQQQQYNIATKTTQGINTNLHDRH